MSPRPGKTSVFSNLHLGVVPDIVVLVVGDIAPTQIEKPLMDTGVEAILPISDRVSVAIVETGSGSTPPILTPDMDILEDLSLQIVRKFFTTMEYCTELALSGRSSFEFVRTLLNNQVENIRQTGGFDRAGVHQVLVE